MEDVGLGVFGLFLVGGAILVVRLMSRSERNQGSDHGGGYENSTDD